MHSGRIPHLIGDDGHRYNTPSPMKRYCDWVEHHVTEIRKKYRKEMKYSRNVEVLRGIITEHAREHNVPEKKLLNIIIGQDNIVPTVWL
jgi:hypothetical protein